MKVRYKRTPVVTYEYGFNLTALDEIQLPDDSAYPSNLDVWLTQLNDGKGQWKDMDQAFLDHDLITDNYNTIFFEPKTPEDRARGYTL